MENLEEEAILQSLSHYFEVASKMIFSICGNKGKTLKNPLIFLVPWI